jgi:hypothetical protein
LQLTAALVCARFARGFLMRLRLNRGARRRSTDLESHA